MFPSTTEEHERNSAPLKFLTEFSSSVLGSCVRNKNYQSSTKYLHPFRNTDPPTDENDPRGPAIAREGSITHIGAPRSLSSFAVEVGALEVVTEPLSLERSKHPKIPT